MNEIVGFWEARDFDSVPILKAPPRPSSLTSSRPLGSDNDARLANPRDACVQDARPAKGTSDVHADDTIPQDATGHAANGRIRPGAIQSTPHHDSRVAKRKLNTSTRPQRNLPAVGFRPMYYIFAMGIVTVYGWYKYKIGIDEFKYVFGFACSTLQRSLWRTGPLTGCSELGREKVWSRIFLTPLLQAEEDRDQVRRMYANKEREKNLLGHEAKVYHSDRYVAVRARHRETRASLTLGCDLPQN